MKEHIEEKSLSEKMTHAFNLSLDLCYDGCEHETKCDHACKPVEKIAGLTKKQEDDVWSMVDGLWHKYYFKRTTGQCSIQAMIDFDVGVFEKEVDDLIEVMESALKLRTRPL